MKILLGKELYEGQLDIIKSYGYDVINTYNQTPSDEELKDVEIIIGNVDYELLKKTPNLKFLQTSTAGSDNYAFLNEINNKVILCNSTGCFSDSISEWVLGMIIYFFKNLNVIIPNQRKHIYLNPGETKGIIDSKVLIIGCGSIGMTTARKLNALGAHVDGVKRTKTNKPEFLDNLYLEEDVDSILGNYDIIIMALPQNKDTRNFMNDKRLDMISKDALLINVGRGSAIDTEHLIKLLEEEKFYCALDVFEKEPLSSDSKLWDLSHCMITPHVTGNDTLEYTRKKIVEVAMYNLDAYINHKEMMNVVDFNTGYKKSNSL